MIIFILGIITFFFVSSFLVITQERTAQTNYYNDTYGRDLSLTYDYANQSEINTLPSILDLNKMKNYLNSDYLETVYLDYYLLVYLEQDSLLSPYYLNSTNDFSNISLITGNYPTTTTDILIPSSLVNDNLQLGSTILLYELNTNQFITYTVSGIYDEEMSLNSVVYGPLITFIDSLENYHITTIDYNNSSYQLVNYADKENFINELREKGLEDYLIAEEINGPLRSFYIEPIAKVEQSISTFMILSASVLILAIIILHILNYQKKQAITCSLLYLKEKKSRIQWISFSTIFPILLISAALGYFASSLLLNQFIHNVLETQGEVITSFSVSVSMEQNIIEGFVSNSVFISSFQLSILSILVVVGLLLFILGLYCFFEFRLIHKTTKKELVKEGFII